MNAHVVWMVVGLGWLVTVPVGLRRLDPRSHAGRVAIAWLPVAAAWAVAAAIGARPLGFSDEIVLLTAAHFVHAGFGMSAVHAVSGSDRPLLLHQVGMVTVAAGIALARPLELVGTAVIVVALAAYSTRALRLARHADPRRRVLLLLSAVAWWMPMTLAGAWALGRVGVGWVDRTLDEMVRQHGAINAIGLVLAGLIAHPRRPRRRSAMRLSMTRPTASVLDELVEAGRRVPLTDQPGLLRRGGQGWFVDRQVATVGHGRAEFEAAADAIRSWIKFRQPWTVPATPLAPIEIDATVGYSARVLGAWWSCCCRIVDVTDECLPDGTRSFGFTYATLDGHPERGEEQFLVTLDPRTGDVRFRILAMSRPGRWFTWLGLPVARRAQARFRRGAAAALRDAVARAPLPPVGGQSSPPSPSSSSSSCSTPVVASPHTESAPE